MVRLNILHGNFWKVYDAAILTVLERAKSKAKLSRAVGVDRSTVTNWSKRIRIPTLEQALAIEKQYNVSKKAIRPDIDWSYIDEKRIESELKLDAELATKDRTRWDI